MSVAQFPHEELSFVSTDDRLPPSNVEVEALVLGCLIFDPHAMARVESCLRPEFFSLDSHRVVFEVIDYLHSSGTPLNLVSVANRLGEIGSMDKVGGQGKLVALVDGVVSPANVDHYVSLLADKWLRREILVEASRMRIDAYSPDSASRLVAASVDRLARLEGLGGTPHTSSSEDIIGDIFSRVQEFQERGEPETYGIPSGFYDVDAMTQGHQLGDFIIVAARPSMGKTAYIVQIARNIAIESGKPVLIFSMEQGKEEIMCRMIAAEANIELRVVIRFVRTGRINPSFMPAILKATEKIMAAPIEICDKTDIGVSEIIATSQQVRAKHGDLGGVFIDYLQLMETGEDRVQGLAKITRSLKKAARPLGCSITALSQLSRGVESRTNKRPMMSDLRESGALEQDADIIQMLYREEYYDPDTPDRGIAEVIVVKNRNGPTGTARLLFEPQFTRFRNLNNEY